METFQSPDRAGYDETDFNLKAFLRKFASYKFDPPPYDSGPFNTSLTPAQLQQREEKRIRVEVEALRAEEERRRVEEEARRAEEERRRKEEEQQRQEDDESAWYFDSDELLAPDLVPRIPSGPGRDAELKYKKAVLQESLSYEMLLNEGGRAWNDFERIQEETRRLEENSGMLKYWQSNYPSLGLYCLMVFTFQLGRWRNFRRWQKRMRKLYTNFYLYISITESFLAKYSTQDMVDMIILEQDPNKQDQLSTWIEYLSYEMRGYYGIAWCKSKASQVHHMAAWRRRANHGALTRRHSRTYIENPPYDQGRSRELRRQRKAAEAERLARLARTRGQALHLTRPGPSRRRRNSLDEEDLDWSRRRSDGKGECGNKVEKYLDTTDNFTIARRKVRHLDQLLQWIKSEAYKIRDEMEDARERQRAILRQAHRQQQQELENECRERLARIETILFGPDRSLHPTVQHELAVQAALEQVAAEESQLKRPRSPSLETEGSEDAPPEKAVCLDNTQFLVNLTFRPRTQEAAQGDSTSAGPSSAGSSSGAGPSSSADAAMSADDAPSAASADLDEELR
ncbi:hypothetical protein EDB81DRAFT_34493 [Dactylonectria macrodidyma]|uniref:Uncharacterized protein n=1 Tax=Dactylonectria macrodidyma TaxID=307937 RepID=A0A9P9FU49_9HYPO|nr:hypothetical protein EDB81DRAFT_34493 [Dactylonectria macrodidyma]